MRFMPTSMTTAPSLIQSPLISSGTPTAAIRTSARRHTSARSRVREWQVVTVALAASSIAEIGLPTRSERPTTTASAPSSVTSWRRSSSMHAARRARPQAREALDQQAGRDRRQPVDVLAGVDLRGQRRAVDLRRRRELEQDAVDRRVRVELVQQRADLVVRRVVRQAGGRSRGCRPRRSPSACRRRRSRYAASSPTRTVASPGGSWPCRDPRRDLVADLVADLLGDGLTVDERHAARGG